MATVAYRPSNANSDVGDAMANANARDTIQVLALLRAALGDLDPQLPLKQLFKKAPECGPFEWMLTILAIEIDLRVDIPEKLADNRKLTAEQFAVKVSQLPKVTSNSYTLDCLGLVAQALLLIESEIADETRKKKAPSTATRKKAARKQQSVAKTAKKTTKPAKPVKPVVRTSKKTAKVSPKRAR